MRHCQTDEKKKIYLFYSKTLKIPLLKNVFAHDDLIWVFPFGSIICLAICEQRRCLLKGPVYPQIIWITPLICLAFYKLLCLRLQKCLPSLLYKELKRRSSHDDQITKTLKTQDEMQAVSFRNSFSLYFLHSPVKITVQLSSASLVLLS